MCDGMPSKDTVKLSDEEGYVKRNSKQKVCVDNSDPQIFYVFTDT